MKNLILIGMVAALAGCAIDPHTPDRGMLDWYLKTAPGAATPSSSGMNYCGATDEIGRCKDWSKKSDMCINPLGINAQPPIVPCASIKQEGK